ncbi:hypothetical protein PF003_g20373 [Phytophthora fragariae]|nr:hypothetical protein PF003_g20373 [Phytophthora fragariae]
MTPAVDLSTSESSGTGFEAPVFAVEKRRVSTPTSSDKSKSAC